MNWLEPWSSVTENERKFLEEQLRSEITSGHKLAGIELEIIGRSTASDDVLCRLKNDELVVVHLVWSRGVNALYPSIQFYKDWQDFTDNRMSDDNFGYAE